MPLKREDLNKQLNLKTTQSDLLKIDQLRVLSDTLNTNSEALSAFLVLMTERHERADINSRQALKIIHKDGTISKLQKTILNFENSEIWKLGQSIWNALQKNNKKRKNELIKQELVHKDDYNDLVKEATQVLNDIDSKASRQHKILLFLRQELGDYQYNQIMTKYKNQLSN
jgi:predicted site-specific integrase-resolvase